MGHLHSTNRLENIQNKTIQWLEIINLYPEADFNDAWYSIMNQVRRANKMNADRGNTCDF
jgi:hypothetical protein